MATLCPTESQEQQALFRWAAYNRGRHPELRLMYHIPNEGKRPTPTGARMRSEGLRKGVPDICLPVPRGPYHGLYIEMKRVKGSRVSNEQKQWLRDLTDQGYMAVICNGFEAARGVISNYLDTGRVSE